MQWYARYAMRHIVPLFALSYSHSCGSWFHCSHGRHQGAVQIVENFRGKNVYGMHQKLQQRVETSSEAPFNLF